mmetsp:Transcript_1820/g.3027  ORF Transcript_1820/g.3027 Transcript_1820/m.3027 type:complete len:717 (+) Transcript_1820:108-2258(+)
MAEPIAQTQAGSTASLSPASSVQDVSSGKPPHAWPISMRTPEPSDSWTCKGASSQLQDTRMLSFDLSRRDPHRKRAAAAVQPVTTYVPDNRELALPLGPELAPNPMHLPLWKRMVSDLGFRGTIRGQIVRNAFPATKMPHPRAHQTEAFRFHLWLLRMKGKNRMHRFTEVRRGFIVALNCNRIDLLAPDDHSPLPYWSATKFKALQPSEGSWRVAIHNSRALVQILRRWWEALPKTMGMLNKKTYLTLNVMIELVLYGSMPVEKDGTLLLQQYVTLTDADRYAMESFMEEDWRTDSKYSKRMDEVLFRQWMLSILDMWTETTELGEYVDLITMLATALFDEAGALMELGREDEVQVTTLADFTKEKTHNMKAESAMTPNELRFMNDQALAVSKIVPHPSVLQVAASLRHEAPSLAADPPPPPPPAPEPAVPPDPDPEAVVDFDFIDTVVQNMHSGSVAPRPTPKETYQRAMEDREKVVSMVPLHSRIVPLGEFNKNRYGQQARTEDFTLEKVVMQRMTKKLNTGDEVADTCALLGYLHDNTIEQEHLQRMSDTSPIVFDNFMQALDVIKFHTDDCLTNDPWGATPVDPQLVSENAQQLLNDTLFNLPPPSYPPGHATHTVWHREEALKRPHSSQPQRRSATSTLSIGPKSFSRYVPQSADGGRRSTKPQSEEPQYRGSSAQARRPQRKRPATAPPLMLSAEFTDLRQRHPGTIPRR